jgi:hypothetical protein
MYLEKYNKFKYIYNNLKGGSLYGKSIKCSLINYNIYDTGNIFFYT